MASGYTARTAFYNKLQSEEKTDELSAILRNEEAQDDFWNLCKSYAEIGMNAPKYRTHGTCEVQGVFQYTDVDNAKDNTVAFIRKYSINGKEDFFDLVKRLYVHAVEFDDARHSGLVAPESTSMSGYAGMYYNFAQLPDDIFDIIKTDSLDGLN